MRSRAQVRRRVAALLSVLVAALLLAACGATASPPKLPHGVYVWQRVWNPPLETSVAATPQFAGSLRVLALQVGPGARRVEPEPNWELLRSTGLPVTVVVRIDGSHGDLAAQATPLQQAVLAQLDRWREHGIVAAGLEIDYDCATAQLVAYAQWLAQLRAQLPPATALSITALPAWREAAALDAVLAAVDQSVLQVHAVQNPAQGLFDAALARRWVDDWSRRSAMRPFLVALPAYGARLKLDEDGAVAAVESEQRLARRSAAARELAVDPRDVAALIAALEARRYPQLSGFVWFRLPHDGDERAWALRTLRAVIERAPLRADLRVAVTLQSNGALNLTLHSDGTVDAPVPSRLRVHGDCSAGDGINGFTVQRDPGISLVRGDTAAVLRAGTSRPVGWLRCADATAVRVTPE
ncbi:DUF3142 domain-containing protein [Tahibacter caeni]|uniref:DUF3142 domain-containing protein n=1 Tax=Tahibacter caeni TaxID=1453545 RepID=UPI0021482D9B|nr:DUF3142 domain-containing protein [Tahibacter caeni]